MIKRCSVCSHPYRPQFNRGPLTMVKFLGRAIPTELLAAIRRPIIGNWDWELTTAYCLLATGYWPLATDHWPLFSVPLQPRARSELCCK